jgi:hypothetical protein
LPLAEFWYKTSFHTSLGCTPFKALYGYDPNIAAAPLLPQTENQNVQELMAERNAQTGLLRQHLLMVQNRIKTKLTRTALIVSSKWENRYC